MFIRFEDENLKARFAKYASFATTIADYVADRESTLPILMCKLWHKKWRCGAFGVLFTTYLLLDYPWLRDILPETDSSEIEAMHNCASRCLFDYLDASLRFRETDTRRKMSPRMAAGWLVAALFAMDLMLHHQMGSSWSMEQYRPKVYVQHEYLMALIGIWSGRTKDAQLHGDVYRSILLGSDDPGISWTMHLATKRYGLTSSENEDFTQWFSRSIPWYLGRIQMAREKRLSG